MAINLGDINFGVTPDISQLQKAVKAIQDFGTQVNRAAKSQADGANATSAALRKQEAEAINAYKAVRSLTDRMNNLGAPATQINNVTQKLTGLVNAMTSGKLTALEFQRAQERFDVGMSNSIRTLGRYTATLKEKAAAEKAAAQEALNTQRANDKAAAAVVSNLTKQQNAFKRAQQSREGTNLGLERTLSNAGLSNQRFVENTRRAQAPMAVTRTATNALSNLESSLTAPNVSRKDATRAIIDYRLAMQQAQTQLRSFMDSEAAAAVAARANVKAANDVAAALRKQESAAIATANAMSRAEMTNTRLGYQAAKAGPKAAPIAARGDAALNNLRSTMSNPNASRSDQASALRTYRQEMQKAALDVAALGKAHEGGGKQLSAFQQLLKSGSSAAVLYSGPLGGISTRLNVLGTMVDSVGGGLALMTAGVVAGAAAFVMIAKNVLETERTLDRANRTMTAVAGSTALGQLEMKFLMETADKTGQTFEELVGPYSKWLSAIKDTGLEGQRGRTAFEQFAASASTLGLSSQASTLALKALEQMMSKGSVQAEELRGQFGDQMPGAFKRAAESMGMTTAKLGDAMKKGLVEPGQFISKFMAEYAKSLGIDTSAQIEGLVATEGRWANSLTKVKDAINATFGITDAYMAILKTMTGWVNYAAANMQDFGAKIQAAQLILASAGETVMTFLGPLKSLADALWLTKSRGEVFSAVMTGVNAAIDFVAGKGTSSKAAAEFTRTAESIKNANDIIAETKSDRTAINGGVPPVEQYIKSMRDAKIQIKTDTDQYLEEAQKSMDRRKAMVEKAQTNLDQIGKTADDQAFNVTRSDPEEAMGNAKKLLAAKLDAQKQLGTAQDLYKTAVSRVHDLELISKKPVNNPWDKLEPKEDKGAAARLRKEAIAIREAMQEIEKTEGERDATSQGPEVLRKWKEGFEQTKEIEKWKDKLTDAGVSADKTAEIIERLSASFKGLKDAQRNVANTTTAMQFMQSAFEKVTDQGVNKFVDALAEGKLSMQTLADIGKSVVSDLLKEFIKLAAINPLKNLLFGTNDKEFAFSVNGQSGVGGLMNNLFKSWSSPSAAANTTTNAASDWGGSSPWTAAKGMAMTPGGSRFGLGSILSKPTLLNSPSGPGLAGEAGAEAIMPLTRGGDGKLGVAANIGGLGGGGSNMNVEIHNYGNTQVTTKKSSGPNGDTLKVMVRDIMMDDAHANGPISRGTQNLYGVSRIGKSR